MTHTSDEPCPNCGTPLEEVRPNAYADCQRCGWPEQPLSNPPCPGCNKPYTGLMSVNYGGREQRHDLWWYCANCNHRGELIFVERADA